MNSCVPAKSLTQVTGKEGKQHLQASIDEGVGERLRKARIVQVADAIRIPITNARLSRGRSSTDGANHERVRAVRLSV
jgi:hypothetical protein